MRSEFLVNQGQGSSPSVIWKTSLNMLPNYWSAYPYYNIIVVSRQAEITKTHLIHHKLLYLFTGDAHF